MPVNTFLQTPGQVGALAGFSDGLRMSYGLAELDRQFRDSDLANKMKENEYENALLDNPVKATGRELATTEANFKKGQYDSGFIQEQADSKLAHERALTEGVGVQSQVQKAILAADTVIGASETIKNNPRIVNVNNWNQMVAEMRKSHVKIPENFEYNQANLEEIHRLAAIAYSTRKHLQEREMLGMRESAAMQIAGTNNDAAMARTRAMVNAQQEKLPTDPDKRRVLENRAAAEAGKEVPLDNITALAPAYIKNDSQNLQRLTADETGEAKIMYGKLGAKDFATWLQKKGLDPNTYKVEGKYEFKEIGQALAEKSIKGQAIEEAWVQSGSPKVPKADVDALKNLYPVLGNKMEANNKAKGGVTPTSGKADSAQPQGKVTNVADVLMAAKLKYPSKTEAELLTALEKAGLIPKQTTSSPIDSHAVPTQAPEAPTFAQTPLGVAAQAFANRKVNLEEIQPNQSVMYE